MTPVTIARPKSFREAGALVTDGRFSLPVVKAGGMDVVDHLKEGLIEPDGLIDIRRLSRGGDRAAVTTAGSRTEVGSTITLAELASSPIVNERAPVVAHACGSAATPQVRNVATAGGNLLQRPRCWYYRHEQFDCLKKGGHTCFAVEGENQFHAVFGPGPCHIVHPSNLAPALMVCDGAVHLAGGERDRLPIADLFHMPDTRIHTEHDLRPGEIITHLSFASAPNSAFYAVKQKQSFDWPLVLAAVSLTLDGGRIASARVCAGAVAPAPWPLPAVDAALAGLDLDDDDGLRAACATATEGAAPMSDNAYKLTLLPVAIRRAVLLAAGREPEGLS